MLNAKIEYDDGAKFDLKLIDNGVEVEDVCPSQWRGNPLAVAGINVEYDTDPNDDDAEYKDLRFTPEHLINLNTQEGRFIFESKGARLIMTRAKEKPMFDYSHLAF